MNPKMLSRLSMSICLVLSALLVVFFFLSWTSLGFSEDAKKMARDMGAGDKADQDVLTASGLQLTIGTCSLSDNRTDKQKEAAEKDEELRKRIEEDMDKAQDEANETISARPWFILGLLVPLAALAAAGAGITGKMSSGLCGVVIAVMGILGILMTVMAVNVSYADDFVNQRIEEMKKDKAPEEQIENFRKTGKEQFEKTMANSGTGIAWISLVFNILVLLGGVAVLAAPAMGGGTPKPTPVSGTPPPSA